MDFFLYSGAVVPILKSGIGNHAGDYSEGSLDLLILNGYQVSRDWQVTGS